MNSMRIEDPENILAKRYVQKRGLWHHYSAKNMFHIFVGEINHILIIVGDKKCKHIFRPPQLY